MAPNMPAGRPGTLTPEQELKLRELWAATLRVFGVHEPVAAQEPNGTDTTSIAASTDSAEKDGKKDKDKKKSRLNVFKRHKDDKEAKSDSAPASGTATPTDISSLSIADEDDKHGQTKEFKAALANMAPEDLRKAFWSMVKHDHPDGLLLRFLRARKWDVEKALVMMVSTMHWRLEEMHVDDDIIRQGELFAYEQSQSSDAKTKKDGEDFLAALRMGKSFLHGLDKEGRPLCFVRVRLHKQGEQSEESIERFTVYTIETARMLLRPPVDTATIVFDMTNFSMANMDYAPVKFMIKCFEANYPESLGAVLVYKAPWLFNTIWSIIRGWLDPVVAGKVHFCKTVEELEAFIPKNQIPTECGGDEKWEYTYPEPVAGENNQMKDEAGREAIQTARAQLFKNYESSILHWIHDGDSQTKSLEERRKERDTIAEELRSNYWKLDPYVRARSLYDRLGVIQQSGKLDFYPSEKPKPSTTQETSPDDLD
ncbi:CRAL/TRIO domain-containing protein [Aaosphaeria arxii CBS 175.79]|uniref:CRAL/TRIO domain-containing protein n=1 Tax=Aaosphaeria arxii CBS 175.79 TaxID=1450172 RepID=A0A6A5XZT7_9PLEO|nr:CRAL/TRIO domain-containing protein [Aaosphaeria arxii CBS 175.79]KAF2018486.1 CRAL/TRIO domain-containing protein [Aaosphaeria arxii CBS 175.79]